MTRSIKIILTTLFLFQIFISCGFELAHDEAYYWLFSKHLDWGYFDHPPFVAFFIKLFSFLPKSEFSVRIGFIFLQFASAIILLNLTSFNLTSLLLFFSFPLASFTGIFALPDTPLLFLTACYAYQLRKYLDNDSLKNSIYLSVIISCLMYAKYHGILLIFFTILAIPKLFLKKSFYITAALSILFLLPHLWWQYQHGFPTFQYQLFERPSASFSFKRSIEYLGIEMILAGFFSGPVTWFIVLRLKTKSLFERSLKFTSIGTIIFFLLSSFTKKIEANWSVFLTIPLIYLSHSSNIWKKEIIKYLLWISFITVLSFRLILILPPDIVGIRRLYEFHGWRNWANQIQNKCENYPIMANSYQIASKLSYYLNKEIGALNYRSRRNQFDFWRFDLKIKTLTKEVCYITDKKEFQGELIKTPDGKTMRIVKNESIDRLWELKLNQR